jgi:hypothetical protein
MFPLLNILYLTVCTVVVCTLEPYIIKVNFIILYVRIIFFEFEFVYSEMSLFFSIIILLEKSAKA